MNNSIKKGGSQLDFASRSPAATIFSFIYGVVRKISAVGGPLGKCAPKETVEKKSHYGPNCKSGGCEVHKSSSLVHNYLYYTVSL